MTTPTPEELVELAEHWDRPYRTMDASGSPTDAAVVGWNWIGEVAQFAKQIFDPVLMVTQGSPVEGGGRVECLYCGTALIAVATTFRDDMNFTVLVRWLCPELRSRASQENSRG